MSLAIRQALTAQLRGLKGQMAEADRTLGQEINRGNLPRVGMTTEALRRMINLSNRQLDKWTGLMAQMGQGERAAEEAIFTAFEHEGESPSEILVKAEELLCQLEIKIDLVRATDPTPGRSAAPAIVPSIQLPTLQLPDFEGKPETWYSFWEAFDQSVHRNPTLSGAQKMTYLYGRLKGSARAMAEGYAFTQANYETIVRKLTDRYGSAEKQKNELQSQLFRLPKASPNPQSLRQLHEDVDEICRKLAGLGAGTDTNTFLTTAIKEKLPSTTLAYLADKEIESGRTWTPRDWRDGLERAVRIQETAFSKSEPSHPQHKKEAPGPSRKSFPPQGQPQQFNRSFPLVNQSSGDDKKPPTPFKKGECSLCLATDHPPSKCPTYRSADQRKKRLLQQKRCLICAREGHFAKDCQSKRGCDGCGEKHHFLICPKKDKKPISGANAQSIGQKGNNPSRTDSNPSQNNNNGGFGGKGHSGQNSSVTGTCQTIALPQIGQNIRSPAYLMVREVPIKSSRYPEVVSTPVFFDPGSQTSFITRGLVRATASRRVAAEQLTVSGFVGNGDANQVRFSSPRYTVMLGREDGSWEEIILNRTDKITPSFQYIKETAPADLMGNDCPLMMKSGEPEILIGIREFWRFIIGKEEISPGFFRIDTVFGPIYGGEFPSPDQGICFTHSMPVITEGASADELVRRLWSLETIGILDKPEQNDNEKAVQLFNKSIKRDKEGRYSVKWPWRSLHPRLPDNFAMAYSRLANLSPKLKANRQFHERYELIFKDQLERGIIEIAKRTHEFEHFLPHHAVVTEKKVRIVFDASAHPKGEHSLNDELFPGPNLVPDLAGMIIRFRSYVLPVLADIKEAFLTIALEESDREVAKFLWIRDINRPLCHDNLVVFRFKRIAFGVISSPFILAATLKHHLKEEGGELAEEMSTNLYVDNLLLGARTVQEARRKALGAKEILKGAKMHLREFICPNSAVLEGLPPEDILSGDHVKVLGNNYDLINERISFTFPQSQGIHTRRKVLATIASFFDPLGLCSPCIVQAKVFFQSLWESKLGWDEPLSQADSLKWDEIQSKWKGETIQMPRFTPAVEAKRVKLLVYNDAGPEAYATAIYLWAEFEGRIVISLIYAKSRLRPRKMPLTDGLTIPRLELLALLIGVRSKDFVLANLPFPVGEIYMWVDSQIVLAWLSSTDHQPVFVANRLAEIRQHRNVHFRYVRSADNPADKGARGVTPAELRSSTLWWHGPEYLLDSPENWPMEYPPVILPPEESPDLGAKSLELKGEKKGKFNSITVGIILEDPIGDKPLMDPSRFGKWNKLVHSAAHILRFLSIKFKNSPTFKAKCPEVANFTQSGAWSRSDYLTARNWVIKAEQNYYKISKEYPIVVKEDGVVRLATRLANAEQSENFKNPIIIPRESQVTKLLIFDAHAKSAHAGVDATLSKFLGTWWCPMARKRVKNALKGCLICKRDWALKFPLPAFPAWPKGRIIPSAPFSKVGLDYMGPSLYRSEKGPMKVWIIIIACEITRAIDLEPVDNCTTESFLMAFRRFVSRRGVPREILSDQGTQLVLARKTLENCPDYKVQWHLITPYSPWKGGSYERLIAIIKSAYRKAVGRKLLTWEQFITFIAEVEAMVNERPISFVSDEIDGPRALRPVDFLHPLAQLHLEEPDESEPAYKPTPMEELAHLWWATNRALREFWQIWSSQYLLMLRGRLQDQHKRPRLVSQETPQVGHIVLIEQEEMPKNTWPLGKIIRLLGPQGKPRSAEVEVAKGRVFERPLSKLIPLELAAEAAEGVAEAPIELPEPAPSQANVPIEEPARQGIRWAQVHPLEAIKNVETERSRGRRPARRIPLVSGTHTIISLCCLFFLLMPTLADKPGIICHSKGVRVKAPEGTETFELCCEAICISRPYKSPFFFPIPDELLVTGFECTGQSSLPPNITVDHREKCTATDYCQIIDCKLCWERVLNPKCEPALAAALIAGLSFILMTGLMIICGIITCFRKIIRNIRWICKFTRMCWPRPVREFRRKIKAYNSSEEEDPEEFYHELLPSWKKTPPRRHVRRGYFTKLGQILAISSLFYGHWHGVEAGIEVQSLTAKTEECWENGNGTECRFESHSLFQLLPAGQAVALIMRSHNGNPMGTLWITLEELIQECLPETKGWVRSYKTDTFAVKRCPTMGSCKSNKCASLKPEESVEELLQAEKFPGNNFCTESSSFWWNDCALPSDSCIFYRSHIVPLSAYPYEIFECPLWEFRFKLKLKLEIPGREIIQEEMELVPPRTFHWKRGNLSLTPTPLAKPDTPILYSRFVSNWTHAALVPLDLPLDLRCQDEFEAKSLQGCSWAIDACTRCKTDHSQGSINCHCREINFENYISDPYSRLPLRLGNLAIQYKGDRVWAELPFVPVQVFAKMEGLTLITKHDLAQCTITPVSLVGCYRCRTGGKFTARCQSTRGEVLADVICQDGTKWVSKCNPEGIQSDVTLNWNKAEISTECRVECMGGTTNFTLNGSLVYIPPPIAGWVKGGGATSLNQPGGDWKEALSEARRLLSWVIGFPQNLIFVGLIIVGIIVLILFIRFNPMFRAYKTAARLMVIIALGANGVEALPVAKTSPLAFLLIALAMFLFGLGIAIGIWGDKWGAKIFGRNKVHPRREDH